MIPLPADGNAAMTSNHGNEGGERGALAADGIASWSERASTFSTEQAMTDDPISASPEHDYCSREGAFRLKAKIEAYWAERGKTVMVTLKNVGFHPAIREARYDIRSDMVGGLPRAQAPAIEHKEAA